MPIQASEEGREMDWSRGFSSLKFLYIHTNHIILLHRTLSPKPSVRDWVVCLLCLFAFARNMQYHACTAPGMKVSRARPMRISRIRSCWEQRMRLFL